MSPFCIIVRFLVIGLTVFDNVICRPSIEQNKNFYPTTDVTSAKIKDGENAVHVRSGNNCKKSKDGSSFTCNDEQLTEEEQQAVLEHFIPLLSTLLRIHVLKNFNKLKVDLAKKDSDCDELEKNEANAKIWKELLLLLHSMWPYRELSQILPNNVHIGEDTVVSKIHPMKLNNGNEIQERFIPIYFMNHSSKAFVDAEKTNIENSQDAAKGTNNLSPLPDKSHEKLVAIAPDTTRTVKPDILQDLDDLIQATINNQRIKSSRAMNSLERLIAEDINTHLKPFISASKQKKEPSSVDKQALERIAEGNLHERSGKSLKESHGQQVSGLKSDSKAHKSLTAEPLENEEKRKINNAVGSHRSAEDEKRIMVSRSVEDDVESRKENQPNSNHPKIEYSEDNVPEILHEDKSEDAIHDFTQSPHKLHAASSRHPTHESEHVISEKGGIPIRDSVCLKFLSLLLKRMAQEEAMRSEVTRTV